MSSEGPAGEKPSSLEIRLKAKKASIEEKVGATLRAKIKLLEDKRDELKRELEELKRKYSEGGEALRQFESKSADLQKTFDTYGDVLRGEGIESKAQMIKNPAFSGDDKILEYKEAGGKVRGKVKEIKVVKSKLKEKVRDLDFKGGKKKREAKSPRDESYEKIEAEITKINQEIEVLESQTPERIEKEKNIGECIEAFNGKVPYLLGSDLNHAALCRSGLDMSGIVRDLIERYGKEVFKEAVLRKLKSLVDGIFATRYAADFNVAGRYDEEAVKGGAMDVIGKKLDLDLITYEIDEMEKKQNAKAIFEEEYQRGIDATSIASIQIERIANIRERLNSKLNERVTVSIDYENTSGGYHNRTKYPVLYEGKYVSGFKACYETPVPSQGTLETKDKLRVKRNWLFELEQKFSKRKRPRIWRTKEFDAETLIAKKEIDKEKEEIKNLENSLIAFGNLDTADNSQGIDELNQIMTADLSFFPNNVVQLNGMTATVEGLLDYIRTYWETAQKSKPNERNAEVLGAYVELKERQGKLKTELEFLARGY
jgi:hypothetical protein